MSSNKVTENTSADQHYRSDALIATGATVSVLILGGVLQFISPKVTPEKMATPAEESKPAVTYSTSLSTPSNPGETSLSPESTSGTNQEIPLVTENLSVTSQPRIDTATAPATTAPATTAPATTAPAIAESTITDPATLEALNSQVLSKIDENWTTNPTFTSSLVYQINVTESGAIASYKEINESAKNYSNETPLPSLIDPAATSDKTAKFVVVFTPSGQLEVSPWISGN
ncbi:hypothetical protein [Planktothricoides raciborskii]|uniref:Uncharacterized protein n=1 Tax=Planktothricoides raciborskii GIHE-MW2 TaxID=2792601 RepID=A0AAU8JJ90_9CYAN